MNIIHQPLENERKMNQKLVFIDLKYLYVVVPIGLDL